MELFESTRANKRRAGNRQHWAMGIALAVGAYLFGIAPFESSAEAQGTHVISGDSKKADKEAKKAERAAARAARKADKEAKKKHKDNDDRSLAKAKTGKGSKSSESRVDLGDDDPLEGL
jgi:hypothetical protein